MTHAPITIFGLDPLGLVLFALGCFLWIEGGKMKRRALEARRFGGGCDGSSSPPLASHHRDSARQNQVGALSEDGQPGDCRVGLPRSRR